VKLYGGEPANFLDIGGGARAERVAAALRILLSDAHIRAVLINIFGGITRCDEVARGLVTALEDSKARAEPVEVPIVVRLVGTNEAEGRRILADAGLVAVTGMDEAARAAVAALEKSRGEVAT
jgi:succinyl-CoA synthetase beta subunit